MIELCDLLGHVLEGLFEVLLAEGELADGPDLGVGLEGLLDLGGEGTSLQSDDLGSGIGVVSDGRATVGAEEAVHVIAGATLASPLLDGAVDGQLILENDGDQGYSEREC
jgi:hypothetical protein